MKESFEISSNNEGKVVFNDFNKKGNKSKSYKKYALYHFLHLESSEKKSNLINFRSVHFKHISIFKRILLKIPNPRKYSGTEGIQFSSLPFSAALDRGVTIDSNHVMIILFINSQQEVHTIYTDIAKAFETVKHKILLSKHSKCSYTTC